MRTVLRGAAVLSSGSIAANVLQFAFAILIARVLGQDGLGTYGTVLAWIFPLSLLVDYGIGTALILLAVWQKLRHLTPPDAGTFRQD